MAKKAAKTVFVLERVNWRWHDSGLARVPGTTRLQSFDDRDQAEEARIQKEKAARAQVNPFACGGPALHYQTSFDDGRLCDWALDLGLTPPKGTKRKPIDWAAWWKKSSKSMSDYQRDRMWEACDRLRFYQVVEREARPVVYVVVRINWRYNDQWFVAEAEGGEVNEAFRDRERAEAFAGDCNDIARDAWEDSAEEEGVEDTREFDMEFRNRALDECEPPKPRTLGGNLLTLEEARFYEVVEVELEE
jgi:hypothetical protein